VDVCIHSPIRLHGRVLNLISIGPGLPSPSRPSLQCLRVNQTTERFALFASCLTSLEDGGSMFAETSVIYQNMRRRIPGDSFPQPPLSEPQIQRTVISIYARIYIYICEGGTRQRCCFTHYATSRKVAGSFSDEVI
jgi:hypothetical protein